MRIISVVSFLLSHVRWGILIESSSPNMDYILTEYHQYFRYLHKLCLIVVKENIGKEKDIACSHGDADDLMKMCPPTSTNMLSIIISNIIIRSRKER